MAWYSSETKRLYELYQQQFDEVRSAVILANRTRGSSAPEKTGMELMGEEEFEQLLNSPNDPEVSERWVKRIIRGYEHEFPNLRVA